MQIRVWTRKKCTRNVIFFHPFHNIAHLLRPKIQFGHSWGRGGFGEISKEKKLWGGGNDKYMYLTFFCFFHELRFWTKPNLNVVPVFKPQLRCSKVVSFNKKSPILNFKKKWWPEISPQKNCPHGKLPTPKIPDVENSPHQKIPVVRLSTLKNFWCGEFSMWAIFVWGIFLWGSFLWGYIIEPWNRTNVNPFFPTVPTCESTIVSEGFKGGTRGSPIMPRDAVSRTAHVGT